AGSDGESVRLAAQVGHPGLVAEDAPTGDPAGGVDRQHGSAAPLADQLQAERLDERALARAWHPGGADAVRAARGGQKGRRHALWGAAPLRPLRLGVPLVVDGARLNPPLRPDSSAMYASWGNGAPSRAW